jgi:hypothetical protein
MVLLSNYTAMLLGMTFGGDNAVTAITGTLWSRGSEKSRIINIVCL